MPTYVYECQNCQHEFEQFQSIKDDPLSLCPQCAKNTLQRKICGENALFQFKGSGFYLTDYKKSSPTPEKKQTSTDTKIPDKKPASDSSS